jgi:ppGpp synthetase/RelA/SpoT-type nucleotidyltranferase
MISQSKIDKIGQILKGKNSLTKSDYHQLLEWRNSFSSILDYYHTKLKSNINENSIITLSRRLKRIESIQIKLMRFSSMRLSTLQDIAGLRVVLKDEISLQQAFSELRGLSNKHKLKRIDNYHSTPKEDGYRSFHLIYQNEKNQQIEVQLRTELEHIWATAVEIYGELQFTSFKTGLGDEAWKEFFALLSSYFAIKENCSPCEKHLKLSEKKIQSRLRKKIKELNVIEILNASTNSFEVIINKYNQKGKIGKYAIIELDLEKKTTTIEYFNKKDVSKAIEIYTKKELNILEGHKKNIVFVNVDDIEKIQSSYPNYFFNTKKLLEILSRIVLKQF